MPRFTACMLFLVTSSIILSVTSRTARSQETSTIGTDLIKGPDIHIVVRESKEPIVIDGKLDDPGWKYAEPYIGYFFQQEPLDRAPSSEKTKVMVVQDKDTIYFGIQSYDSEPDKIFASAMRQDKDIFRDDVIELLIDTFQDYRNCYAFATNPLGVKGDAIISDEGSDINKSWDCIWQVKSSINAEGWVTEMAFPFKSLKYKKGDIVEWGLNITRNIKHTNETTYLVPIPRGLGHDGKFKGELFAILENIKTPSYTINMEVQPYIRGGYTSIYEPEKKHDSELDAGFDVRYHITPQLTADATYNTDFAQVESEEEVVNVTRFNIYLPEKRDFFLENAGLFNFSMTSSAGEYYDADADFILFNSRTIGIKDGKRTPLYGGAKVAGRVGKFSLGVMNIESERTSIDSSRVEPSTNYTAFRLKRDLFSKSYVGMMVLNKESAGDEYSRTFGADGFLSFSQEFNMKGSLAKTMENDTEDNGKNWAGDVKVTLNKEWIDGSISYTFIDSLFNPQMGYVRRGDIRKTDGNLSFTKWLNNRYLKSISWENGIVYTTNHNNTLETRENQSELSFSAPSGDNLSFSINRDYDFLPDEDYIRDIRIDAGRYTVTYKQISLNSYQARTVSGNISYQWGEQLDGESKRISVTNRTKLSNHFNMDLNYTYNDLDLKNGSLTANVLAGRWTYSFTTEMFAKCYIQWNDADERISTNLLFDYVYRPKSHLYIVYNENRNTLLDSSDNITDRIMQVKVTYMWGL
ncbi:carbohydrate binding family 9 domain-containing protein [bacterium]|nr:carbohydrate binding family 9 domain-containing protein [bacterium]